MGKNVVVFVMGMIFLTISSVYAKEAENQPGDNASESGKNEIPICKKTVPIEVGISPEFVEKYRLSGQTREDYDGAQVLGGDRVTALQKYEVTKRIEYAIACELERLGYATPQAD